MLFDTDVQLIDSVFSVLTVARCIAICKPLKASIILTHRKARVQILACTALVFLVNIPFIFAFTLNEVRTKDGKGTGKFQCNSVSGKKTCCKIKSPRYLKHQSCTQEKQVFACKPVVVPVLQVRVIRPGTIFLKKFVWRCSKPSIPSSPLSQSFPATLSSSSKWFRPRRSELRN